VGAIPTGGLYSKMPKIEERYKKLAKKHKLPDFKKMDAEFEISSLEETNFLLRSIMSKMGERIEFFLTSIGEILNPDTSNIYSVHEYRFIDEKERNNLFEIYRKLMSFSRYSLETSLSCDEKKEAEFISSFYEQWQEIKPEFVKFFKKLKESWNIETDIKEYTGYLG